MADLALYAAEGHVRLLTLNRPQALNAFNGELDRALSERLLEFRGDADAWVLVITGEGRAFSAGRDLKEGFPDPLARPRTLIAPDALELAKPVIAAVGGYCLGGGLELALACDVRIAADDARFGLPEAKRGIMPGAGGTQRLPRLIGLGAALHLMFSGEPVDAAEALRLGLVQRVVPRADLVPAAMEYGDQLCHNGPLALQAIKQAAVRGLEASLPTGLRLERALSVDLRRSEDAAEGRQAFVEKRPPRFQGR